MESKILLALAIRDHSMVRKDLAKTCSGLDEEYTISHMHLYMGKDRGNFPKSH